LNQEELISLSEAAAQFGVSAGHLRFLVSRGVVRGKKIGRNWVTTRKAVAEYMRDSFERSKDPHKRQR
jgi:excisionase family DNA binding protein